MGARNILIEGVSGAGKTSVATELALRGCHVVHGDRELAYTGDPQTGRPVDAPALPAVALTPEFWHGHHIWDEARVRAIAADASRPLTFFCGGARNSARFLDVFDTIIVLEIDAATLRQRVAARGPMEFGGRPDQLALILRLHATGEDLPHPALRIDATRPLSAVVDAILAASAD